MNITKQDIEGFFKVLSFLEENQDGGIHGLGNLHRVQLTMLKYIGIGEGMEYESLYPNDLKELREELEKRVTDNDIIDIPCDFGTSVAEFERYVGRKPMNDGEIEDWVRYQKKGMDAQLDWNMICQCAADNFPSKEYLEENEND